MRRIRILAVALAVGLLAVYSLSATARWQGTWNYYDSEGCWSGSGLPAAASSTAAGA